MYSSRPQSKFPLFSIRIDSASPCCQIIAANMSGRLLKEITASLGQTALSGLTEEAQRLERGARRSSSSTSRQHPPAINSTPSSPHQPREQSGQSSSPQTPQRHPLSSTSEHLPEAGNPPQRPPQITQQQEPLRSQSPEHNSPSPSTTSTSMAENVPPAGGASGSNGDVPGQPFYDKARHHLKDLIERQKKLTNKLGTLEDAIYKEETDYLEGTPSGNIIKGFENYTKGTGSSAPGQRRRVPVNNEDRLFSRSSVTYNLNAVSFVLSLSNGEGRC